MSNYSFTIIIPTYNSENTIGNCLRSIVLHSRENFSVIICDDGSLDNSVEIARRYESKYEFIHLIQLSHAGVSHARNVGIRESDSDAIVFCDSDDTFTEDAFDKIVENYNGEDVLVFTEIGHPNVNNVSLKLIDLVKSVCGMDGKGLKADQYSPVITSKIYKSSFLNDNEIQFDEKLIVAEDMMFNLNVVKLSQETRFVEGIIYNYVENVKSTMHRFNSQLYENEIYFNELFRNFISNIGYEEECKNIYTKITLGGILVLTKLYYLRKKSSILSLLPEIVDFISMAPRKEALRNKKKVKNFFSHKEYFVLRLCSSLARFNFKN